MYTHRNKGSTRPVRSRIFVHTSTYIDIQQYTINTVVEVQPVNSSINIRNAKLTVTLAVTQTLTTVLIVVMNINNNHRKGGV